MNSMMKERKAKPTPLFKRGTSFELMKNSGEFFMVEIVGSTFMFDGVPSEDGHWEYLIQFADGTLTKYFEYDLDDMVGTAAWNRMYGVIEEMEQL